jgi:hypothetical protein
VAHALVLDEAREVVHNHVPEQQTNLFQVKVFLHECFLVALLDQLKEDSFYLLRPVLRTQAGQILDQLLLVLLQQLVQVGEELDGLSAALDVFRTRLRNGDDLEHI